MARRASMTYGQMPDYDVFYDAFEAEVGTGVRDRYVITAGNSRDKWTRKVEGEYVPKELYALVRRLTEAWERGDDAAGDLASSILQTLGIEWI